MNSLKSLIVTFVFLLIAFFGFSQNILVNASFENPVISPLRYSMPDAATVPGWNTDDVRNTIEIWTSGQVAGVTSGDGGQHVELNNSGPTSIWQDFVTQPGATLWWDFLHRARGNGIEQVEVLIGPPGSLVSQGIFTGTFGEWTKNGAEYQIPSGQTNTRILIKSLAPANSLGNLIDAVSVEIHSKIPTLGEWGVGILFMLLMILGITVLRQSEISLTLSK